MREGSSGCRMQHRESVRLLCIHPSLFHLEIETCVNCLLVVPDYYPLVVTDPESVEDSANRLGYLLQEVFRIIQSVQFTVYVASLVFWKNYERFRRMNCCRTRMWENRLVARSK